MMVSVVTGNCDMEPCFGGFKQESLDSSKKHLSPSRCPMRRAELGSSGAVPQPSPPPTMAFCWAGRGSSMQHGCVAFGNDASVLWLSVCRETVV